MSTSFELSEKEIEHIGRLANLTLSEEEVVNYGKQLSDVLGYVELLNELETADVEETAQVTGLVNVVRSVDGAGTRTLKQSTAVSQAKRHHDNYVIVPAILEERD